jgi:hypothetical protein|uniref:Uncharacterized protein n=1 Tax=viral metagenome TaxID=1070528 RepID=A0A6C0K8E2_9ZZZZ
MLREFAWEWLPWLYNRVIRAFEKSKGILFVVKRELFSEKKWVFLKGHAIPISEDHFSIISICPNDIRWIATLEPPRLFHPDLVKTPEIKEKHISYLSYIIHITTPFETTILDLSDWINDLKWSGIKEPSPLDIFSLWCCKNASHHIYNTHYMKAIIITEDGIMIEKGLNEFTNTTIYEDDIHDNDVR